MVSGGYVGRILRVNLTSGRMTDEALNEDVLRRYVGGLGLAVKIMYDEVSPSVRPLDPENRVVFMTGPLSGTPAPASSRHVVYTLNPDIPKICSPGFAGGFWAADLKIKGGYDGIVVQGAAEEPVYLWVHDGEAELRDASRLWGRDTFETEDLVKREVGDPEASLSCIGPAGESVTFGSIILNDRRHHSTKGGGALGSKRLKAIAVGGRRKPVPIADAKKAVEVAREWRESLEKSWVGRRRSKAGNLRYWGHPAYFAERSPWILMVKNLSDPEFAYEYGTGLWKVVEASKVTPIHCYNCTIGCAYDIEIGVGPHKGRVFSQAGGAEHYEGLAGNIGVSEGGTVLSLVDILDRMGLDSAVVGGTIGLAYECYERGLLKKEDTDGLELRWGNADAAVQLLGKIVRGEGFGAVLSKGPKETAKRISQISGRDATRFAVHVKGSGIFAHEVRISFDALLGIFTCNNGPILQGLGALYDPEPDYGYKKVPYPFDPERAPMNVRQTQIKKIWEDCLGVCWFNTGCVPNITTYTPRMLSCATGWDVSREEADLVGERIANMTRVFNLRRGLRAEDDFDIGPRLLEPPSAGLGKDACVKPHLAEMIRKYYGLMGWDETTGVPLKETLQRVGLEELVKDVEALPSLG